MPSGGSSRDLEARQPRRLTELLRSWQAGNAKAGEELAPLVYDELRRLARRRS
jgi:hypothetical protein